MPRVSGVRLCSLYCALFVAAYVAARRLGKETVLLRSLGLAALMSILLTAYFIGPLLEHKAANSYAIFNSDVARILNMSANHLRDHAVKLGQLFSHNFILGGSEPLASDQPEMSFLLGMPLILFAALGTYAMRRHAVWGIVRFSIAAALLSLVILLEGFPWELMPEFLYYIQFPWRLLLFTVFFKFGRWHGGFVGAGEIPARFIYCADCGLAMRLCVRLHKI